MAEVYVYVMETMADLLFCRITHGETDSGLSACISGRNIEGMV